MGIPLPWRRRSIRRAVSYGLEDICFGVIDLGMHGYQISYTIHPIALPVFFEFSIQILDLYALKSM